MGKEKRSRRKKFDVPMEANEKVEQIKKNGEAEGGEREGRVTEGANRACPDCPVQPKKRSKNVEWTPSPSFINLLEKAKGKNRAGPPAKWEEQIEREQIKRVNEILKQCKGDNKLAAGRLLANSLEFEEVKRKRGKEKANAPPFTPSSSIHQSSQTQLRGNDSSTGHGFTHPYVEPSYYQLQLPLQHGYMNSYEYMDQNFGYDMTSPQQEVYRGGSSSWANADPSGWGSFPGRGSTPQSHQFLPNSSAPFDSSRTQLNSALHVKAQRQHRNDYCPIGMSYNFGAWNIQLDPGAVSALPKQQQQAGFPGWVPLPSDGNNQHHAMPSAQQGGFPGWVLLPSDGNNQHHDMPSAQQGGFPGWVPLPSDGNHQHHAMPSSQQGGFPGWVPLPSDSNDQHHDMPSAQQGGFPRWVPLPSDGNNQHHDMPSAQQELNQGGGSSWANASTSGWGSIQGTGSTCSQFPPIPPHSTAPFNISWTSHDSTLEAQDQYRNDHPFLIIPGLASTPHGHFPEWVPLPTNGRNWQAGEGSSSQYVYHGWHHPGTHQQQSPYNTSTGNLQDLSTMQPPQGPGP